MCTYWQDHATAVCTHVTAGAGRGCRIAAAFIPPHPARASPKTMIAMAAMPGVSNGMPGPKRPTFQLYSI
jgi:hypothetical protein